MKPITLSLFIWLTIMFCTRPAQAQTETVLYDFTGGNGGIPTSTLTSDGKGNFYGTTFTGGDAGAISWNRI
jgi:hypothetical protein